MIPSQKWQKRLWLRTRFFHYWVRISFFFFYCETGQRKIIVLLLIWNTLKNICLLHLLPPWQMCPVDKLISPIYTRKMSLESDWPRAMQFLVNTVQKWRNIMQKQGNKMQISQRWEHCDWLINNRNILEPITQHQHSQIRWVPGYEQAISKVSRVTVENRFH